MAGDRSIGYHTEDMERTALEEILGELVAIPTVTSNVEANRQLIEYVRRELAKANMHIKILRDGERDILVATTRHTNSPEVLLVAHGDVVPASDNALFKLRSDEHKLYGRGVLDMKFAIAAYMEVVKKLTADLQSYDFGIAVTTDEEASNHNVVYLLEQGYSPKSVVLLDGGDAWQLESAAKGAWTVKLTVHGRGAHGSQPWAGDSASFKLLSLLDEIKALFAEHKPHTDTLNISMLAAGQAVNQIPDKASAVLDVRVVNEASLRRLQQKIGSICDRYNAEQAVSALLPPLEHDLSNHYLQTFAEVTQEVTGQLSAPMLSYGASEAAHFKQRNIPCVVTAPAGGGRHGDDEWVSRQSLNFAVPILVNYLRAVAHIGAKKQ
ncbi:MAG TPA: M20/M25/M40 family metallo-hydrolase [Candidatus Saccharimonadales bacterium]|nr:M20/M25/M40 family metallo-hydrolase [Candidatus Saccharimonadales bacterium]